LTLGRFSEVQEKQPMLIPSAIDPGASFRHGKTQYRSISATPKGQTTQSRKAKSRNAAQNPASLAPAAPAATLQHYVPFLLTTS
jgi:hypothetical protein